MLQQTKQHRGELLNTQLNAGKEKGGKENYSKEEVEENPEKKIIERIPVENTPFTMIRRGEECFGVFGKYRVTEIKKTIPEVEEELTKFNWTVLARVIAIVSELIHRDIEKEEEVRATY